MKLTNPWVGYLDRSYKDIKTSILNRLRILTPELTDLSDSNILVILVSILAGIAEQLGYYVDTVARESYITTARKFSSMLKVVKLINYRVRSNISASVDLTFTIPTNIVEGTVFTIPAGTLVTTSDGVEFTTVADRTFLTNTHTLTVGARQRLLVTLTAIGESTGAADQSFTLPLSYEDQTLVVEVDGYSWELQDDLAFSSPTSKHFYVSVPESGAPTLVFGDGVKGAIPTASEIIYVSYYTTLGADGNKIGPASITENSTIVLPVQTPTIDELTITNIDYPAGGTNREGIEEIRKFAPLYLRTLNRAVTEQDYIDIARLSPGVDKAAILFNCGKKVKIYIAPLGGGIAANSLLESTLAFMEKRKMVTTFLDVQAAGETYLKLDIEATARFRVNPILVGDDIKEALIQAYSGDNSNINKPIRLSDVIALIDNLERVDFLNIHYISAVPYARPINSSLQLPWVREVLGGSKTKIKWKLIYTGGIFKLYKEAEIVQDVEVGVEVTYLDILKFTISSVPATAVNGTYWEFYTYPYNQDITLDDYTVPRIHPYLTYVTITVNPQSYING